MSSETSAEDIYVNPDIAGNSTAIFLKVLPKSEPLWVCWRTDILHTYSISSEIGRFLVLSNRVEQLCHHRKALQIRWLVQVRNFLQILYVNLLNSFKETILLIRYGTTLILQLILPKQTSMASQ